LGILKDIFKCAFADNFVVTLKESKTQEATWCTPSIKLYKDHKPTSTFQKCLLVVGSSLVSLYNPERADMVAVLGETTGSHALKSILEKMESDPVGRTILLEKPRINSTTVDPTCLKTVS